MKLIKTASLSLALGLFAGFAAASNRTSDPPPAPLKLAGTWKLNKELSDDPAQKMREIRSASGSERGGRGGGGGMGGRGGGGGGYGGGGMGGRGGGGGYGGGGGMGGRGGGGGYGGGEGGSGGGRGPGGRGGPGLFGGEPPLDGNNSADRPNGQSPAGQGGAAGESSAPSDQEGRGQRRGMGLAASPQFAIEQEGDNMAFRTPANLRLMQTNGEKQKTEGAAGKVEMTAKFLKGSLVIETKAEGGGKRKETYTILQDGKLQADFDFEGFGQMPALKFKLIYDAAPAPTAQF